MRRPAFRDRFPRRSLPPLKGVERHYRGMAVDVVRIICLAGIFGLSTLGALSGCATTATAPAHQDAGDTGGQQQAPTPSVHWDGDEFSEPVSGILFPKELGDLRRIKTKGSAKENLGVVINYRAGSTGADFFVYPGSGKGRLADGIESSGVKAQFSQSLGAVKEMQRRGLYQRAELVSKGPRELPGGVSVLHAAMRLSMRGRQLVSALYVRGVAGYVFKIRVSYPESDSAAGDRHIEQIERAISRMLADARAYGPLAMASPRR